MIIFIIWVEDCLFYISMFLNRFLIRESELIYLGSLVSVREQSNLILNILLQDYIYNLCGG